MAYMFQRNPQVQAGPMDLMCGDQKEVNKAMWETSEELHQDHRFMNIHLLKEIVSVAHVVNQSRVQRFLQGEIFKPEWLCWESPMAKKGVRALTKTVLQKIKLALRGVVYDSWLEKQTSD